MNALMPDNDLRFVLTPCNQFGHQEPGDNATEILNSLEYVRPGHGYKPHKDILFALKSDVNGAKEMPLYRYLKDSCPSPKAAQFNPRECFWDPFKISDIEWNFEKFLVSESGVPLFRFRPAVEPQDLTELMSRLLAPVDSSSLESQRKQLQLLLAKIDQTVAARTSPY